MPPPAERHPGRIVAAYAVLLTVVLTATVPIYLAAEPARRPAVIRLAAAAILAVVTLHVLGAARKRIEAQAPSDFERAVEGSPLQTMLDPRFRQLRDELKFGAQSRGYFQHVLWPQLAELTIRLRRKPPDEPAGRRFGRGPSPDTISRLIDQLEERS